ncbi:MAG: hypothetical protein HY330_07330, partial [Chloroflexi bacterium]|nr:hypothetical protein [Chloroflexota bacterium]
SSPVRATSLAVWLAPWEGELVLGATLELPSEEAARLAAALADVGQGRAIARGRHLAVVRGDGAATTSLAAAIEQKGLVPFAGRNPEAAAVIAWLPSAPPPAPTAVAYGHLSDEVLAYLSRRTGSQELADVAVAVRGARISRAAAAIYAPALDLTALGSLDRMSAQTAGIVVAPARLPGSLVGSVLRSSAGGLGLEEASLPGGPAFTRTLGPQRLYVANVGNKLYVSFSQDDARAQALLDSARQGR